MDTTLTQRIARTVSGPLVATGIILGSMVVGDTAGASAEPISDSPNTSMTMTGWQGGAAANALTGV